MPVHSPEFVFQLNVIFTHMTVSDNILFRWYNVVHLLVPEKLRDFLVFPIQKNSYRCTQRASSHTTWSGCNISGLAIFLRGQNIAAGSLVISSCLVSSCFLKKCNTIVTSPVIHIFLINGQMKILTPLWTAALNNISVALCGVQAWIISWLLLSSSKVVLERSLRTITAAEITRTFGGSFFE